MSFIAKIKQYFFQRSLEQERRAMPVMRAVEPVHPLSAPWVAILFLADDEQDRKAVEAYRQARKNEGLRTELLGFFSKEVNQAAYSFDQFSGLDANWCGVPKGTNIEKFLERSCDLLFTLGTAKHPQLDYIASLKKAKLKVGPHTGLADNPHDVQFFVSVKGINIAEQLRQIDQIFKVTNVPKVPIAV